MKRTRTPLPLEARQDLDPEHNPLDRALLSMMQVACVTVAPGVRADVHDNGAWIEVRGVMEDVPRIPGAVGEWLDTLPRDRKVIVPAVTSRTLAYMLHRRGFECVVRWDEMVRMWDVGAMQRNPDTITITEPGQYHFTTTYEQDDNR